MITNGKADVSRDGEHVRSLGPGDFFGELALLSREPRDATVTAATDMEVLVVSASEFRTLLEDAPGLTYRLLEGMARRLRELDELVAV